MENVKTDMSYSLIFKYFRGNLHVLKSYFGIRGWISLFLNCCFFCFYYLNFFNLAHDVLNRVTHIFCVVCM